MSTKIKQEAILGGSPTEISPVYFQSLTISGVRCFKEETVLRFCDSKGTPEQWTVILGENGVGKTTVLRCLAGLSAGVITGVGLTIHTACPLMFAGLDWLHWRLASHSVAQPILDCKANLASGRRLREDNDAPWDKVTGWGFSGTSSEASASRCDDPDTVAGLRCYGYGAGRRTAASSSPPFDTSPQNAVRSLMGDDQPLINAEEWLKELDHAAKTEHKQKQQAITRRNEVEDLLKHVLPEIEEIDMRISEGPAFPGFVRAQFKTPFGWVNFDSLSFGYQSMIAWIVDVTRRLYERYPESENPIAEPAIVLIDEIDLHLHPKWQQTVMDYLSERFVNTQFIVTAHSPLIIQSPRAANVILLQREGDHVVARQDLDSIRQWRVDQILTSDLFGLERARPPGIEKIYEERASLLRKPSLTDDEKRRIEALNAQIHQLPTAETEEMREVEALLRKVAAEHRKTPQKA